MEGVHSQQTPSIHLPHSSTRGVLESEAWRVHSQQNEQGHCVEAKAGTCSQLSELGQQKASNYIHSQLSELGHQKASDDCHSLQGGCSFTAE